jgi:hypothetical protein
MVNMIWQDEATGIYVVTHELFSRPAQLIGVVLPLVSKKQEGTSGELKAVVTCYEAKLGYKLQKDDGMSKLLSLGEVEKLYPYPHPLTSFFSVKAPGVF